MSFEALDQTSIEKLKQEIASLKMLKSALGFRRQENITKEELFNVCIEHNKNEIYLLIYIIDCIYGMPSRIKEQYGMLIRNIKNKEQYRRLIAETEILYETESVFINQKKRISKDLELKIPSSRYFFNQVIYEFCLDCLDDIVCLNDKNVVLNLHFMQKWLYEQDYECIKLLTGKEIELFSSYLRDGYISNDNESLEAAEKIKEKLNSETIFRALAKFYFSLLQSEKQK